MTGSAAIRKGVKEGIDDARLTDHTKQIAAKLGGDHPGLMARVEALEAKAVTHNVDLQRHEARLERHRLRIRWLERWAHIHWPGWFSRPGL